MTATAPGGTGRVNQKLRTRTAIVQAAAELMATGRDVTMPEIARAALVSEATAYRYFPDLASLLREAMAGHLPDPTDALAPVAGSTDPVERVAFATEYLMRHVLARQGAVRAMIAATVARPGGGASRPGLRVGLIDHALAPIDGVLDRTALHRLKLSLGVVVSAEALFSLTDLYGLEAEEAIATAVHAATTLTRAALPEKW